eukprot:7390175-Prymnesium_polylepis.2
MCAAAGGRCGTGGGSGGGSGGAGGDGGFRGGSGGAGVCVGGAGGDLSNCAMPLPDVVSLSTSPGYSTSPSVVP